MNASAASCCGVGAERRAASATRAPRESLLQFGGGTRAFRLRLIRLQDLTGDFFSIQSADRGAGMVIVRIFDKTESAGCAGAAIAREMRRRVRAERSDQLGELRVRHFLVDVSDVHLH